MDVNKIGLNDLHQMNALSNQVDYQMKDFGLGYPSSSSDSTDDEQSEPYSMGARSKKGRKIKSGIEAKASDKVKRAQLYPHSTLQYEYLAKGANFWDLDFRALVAGEMEIITHPGISEEERMGRCHLLKKIAYYHPIYEWNALLNLYAAVLRRIELGQATWVTILDNCHEIEIPILARHLKPQKGDKAGAKSGGGSGQNGKLQNLKADDRTWFCSLWNRGTCNRPDSHPGKRGKFQVVFKHIRAQCWLTDQVPRAHTESDPSCPQKVQRQA
jgi:hypothetical protein